MGKRKETPNILASIQEGRRATDPAPPAASSGGGEELKKDTHGRKSIYLDNELWKQLVIHAKQNDTSASEIIGQLIKDYLSDK